MAIGLACLKRVRITHLILCVVRVLVLMSALPGCAMTQISTFMNEIADEFKIIVVHAIRQVPAPCKQCLVVRLV
jgi:hypothetical protein